MFWKNHRDWWEREEEKRHTDNNPVEVEAEAEAQKEEEVMAEDSKSFTDNVGKEEVPQPRRRRNNRGVFRFVVEEPFLNRLGNGVGRAVDAVTTVLNGNNPGNGNRKAKDGALAPAIPAGGKIMPALPVRWMSY